MSTGEKIPRQFRPRWTNPFFLMRYCLLETISRHGAALSGRLLDFGCGTKPYRSLFAATEYIGVDLGKADGSASSADLTYDGKRLPFPDGHFDSVLSTEVFEHVFNLEEVLAELHRVLKPGGKLLLTCPFIWELHEIPYDYARYTPFALRALLERNGFCVLAMETNGHALMAISQLLQLYLFYSLVEPLLKRRLTHLLGRILSVMLGTTGNLAVLALQGVLPARREIYLSNLVLAEGLARTLTE